MFRTHTHARTRTRTHTRTHHTQESGEPLDPDGSGEGQQEGAEGAGGAEGILDWGDRVRVHGLAKKPELNGLIATVKDFKAGASDEEGRVVIELEELKT